jgi:hypothetical protein
MSLLVLRLFISGFRGNDACLSDAGKFQRKGSCKKSPRRKRLELQELIGYGQSTPTRYPRCPPEIGPNRKAG